MAWNNQDEKTVRHGTYIESAIADLYDESFYADGLVVKTDSGIEIRTEQIPIFCATNGRLAEIKNVASVIRINPNGDGEASMVVDFGGREDFYCIKNGKDSLEKLAGSEGKYIKIINRMEQPRIVGIRHGNEEIMFEYGSWKASGVKEKRSKISALSPPDKVIETKGLDKSEQSKDQKITFKQLKEITGRNDGALCFDLSARRISRKNITPEYASDYIRRMHASEDEKKAALDRLEKFTGYKGIKIDDAEHMQAAVVEAENRGEATDEAYYTSPEVAELLGIGRTYVSKYTKSHGIEKIGYGKYPKDEIDELVKKLKGGGAKEEPKQTGPEPGSEYIKESHVKEIISSFGYGKGEFERFIMDNGLSIYDDGIKRGDIGKALVEAHGSKADESLRKLNFSEDEINDLHSRY